ncbi:MAG TPA: hypothetical protein VIK78_01970 [Ruminiclostridium sp.]
MNKEEREYFFIQQEESLLKGGASLSEWCTFMSKSVYVAFVNGADLATIITVMACIETYFKTEELSMQKKNLAFLIDKYPFLGEKGKENLHMLRKYRNRWVHIDCIDDTPVLKNEDIFIDEVQRMACLSIEMLLTVLFSHPYI